jgi:hypothetical protein
MATLNRQTVEADEVLNVGPMKAEKTREAHEDLPDVADRTPKHDVQSSETPYRNPPMESWDLCR